jgi:hypothetical protein
MHRLSLRLAPLLVAVVLCFSVFQAAAAASLAPLAGPQLTIENQHEPATTASESTTNIKKNVLWMFSGIGASAIVLTALYMLKRRVGAFPENPDWVAPITIMRSKDAPDEGAYGAVAGHDAHGSHH